MIKNLTKITSVLALGVAMFAQQPNLHAQTTLTYTYTGAVQSFTIPPCVGTITITARGAKGGTSNGTAGGNGGSVRGILTATAGQVLYFYVGGTGATPAGGFNGGGNGGTSSSSTGAGGGGATDVRVGGTALANRIIVAAGGGGGGGSTTYAPGGGIGGGGSAFTSGTGFGGGGATGCATGTSGGENGGAAGSYGSGGGGGGFASGGGGGGQPSATTGGYGCAGALGLGGNGGGTTPSCGGATGGINGGGGGGGGFYGGGGGMTGTGGCNGGGGGGSSWISTILFSSPSFTAGSETGNGAVEIIYTLNGTGVTTNITNTAICVGSSVTINATGVVTFTWLPDANFAGSNASSVVVSPTATTIYTVQGNNSLGCLSSTVVNVTVNGSVPSLSIANTASASGGICPNSTVALTASGATTYTWTGSVVNGVAFGPTVPSTYIVSGTNACGTTTSAVSVSVHPLPSVTPVVAQPTICSGLAANLSAVGSGTSYAWSGGVINGTNFFPSATNNYTVIATSALGCTNSAVAGVTVVITPSNPAIPNPPLICIGSTATLSSSGATNYTWTTPSGTQSGSLITVSPLATTIYTLTKSNSNCLNTQTVQVLVNNLPVISAFANPTLVCANNSSTLFAGGAQTYTWNAGGTPAFTLTGASPIVNPSVTTTYTLSASDGTCINTTTLTVATNPNPTVTIVPTSTNICRGDQVSLTANGALGYTWTSPAISSNTTATTILETPQVTTLFIVTGTNNFNCSTTAQQVIIVRPTPTLQIGTTKPLVCTGAPSSMTVSSAAGAGVSPCTYVWSSNAASATTSVVTVNPLVTTSYSVVGLAPNQCTTTINYPISVFLPTFAVNSPTQSCEGGTIVLQASGANTYTWNGNQPFAQIPVSPKTATNYVVAATSSSNGVNCVSTNTVFVTIYLNPTVTAVSTRTQVCRTESTTILGGGAVTYTLNTNDTGTLITVYPVGNATTYTLTGTDQNGCTGTATVSIKTSICFGIEEQALASKLGLNMYPNPNNGSFNISTASDVNVRLENELGQLIALYELNADNNHKTKVEGLAAGVYFVTISKDGEHATGKIIVTK